MSFGVMSPTSQRQVSYGGASTFGHLNMKRNPSMPLAWQEDPQLILGSLGVGGYKIPPLSVSYEALYRMANQDVVVQIIHEAILRVVQNFFRRPDNRYDYGFKIRKKGLDDREYTDAIRNKCHKLEEWFLNCGEDDGDLLRDDLPTFARKVVSDWLTFDQSGPEIVRRRDGKPKTFRHIPGYTLRVVPPQDATGYVTPHQQRSRISYVQVDNHNNVVAGWTEDRVLWSNLRPRTTQDGHRYGKSPLETLINTVISHLFAEQWNTNIFRNGSSIPGIVNFEGNPGKEKMRDFRRQWILQAVGVENAHRVVFTNAQGVKWIPMNWSNQEMGFTQWIAYLMELMCALYGVSPAMVGLEIQGRIGGASSSHRRGSHEVDDRVDGDKNKFLKPILYKFERLFNGPKMLGSLAPGYEFRFFGINPKDEQKDVELYLKKAQMFMDVNEARAHEGLPPRPEWEGVPINPVISSHITQQQAMSAMPEEGGGGQYTQTSQGRTAEGNIEEQRRTPHNEDSDQEGFFDMSKSILYSAGDLAWGQYSKEPTWRTYR